MRKRGEVHIRQAKYRWYSMDPHSVHLRGILYAVVLVLISFAVTEKHLWRWSWQSGPHAWYNCRAVTDAEDVQQEAWRWVEGKEIRIYVSPSVPERRVKEALDGVRDLVSELGLDIAVYAIPFDQRISQSLARGSKDTGTVQWVDFDAVSRELVMTRQGQYAEIVITPGILGNAMDTLGLARFSHGVALLSESYLSRDLARHEVGHLLGYHMHDNMPFVVLGYESPQAMRWSGDSHDSPSLMMPVLEGSELSPRSHDAIVSFWRGLEKRTGSRFFTGE